MTLEESESFRSGYLDGMTAEEWVKWFETLNYLFGKSDVWPDLQGIGFVVTTAQTICLIGSYISVFFLGLFIGYHDEFGPVIRMAAIAASAVLLYGAFS